MNDITDYGEDIALKLRVLVHAEGDIDRAQAIYDWLNEENERLDFTGNNTVDLIRAVNKIRAAVDILGENHKGARSVAINLLNEALEVLP